jgi:hypothetical protein
MKTTFMFLCLSVFSVAYCTSWSVKLDGSGDFSTIQTAIHATVNGDTLLVYPGTYYENINYSGKNITIASLELTTGNPAYRDSTIIDGNHSGSCIRVITNENGAAIYGFTIQHGSGSDDFLFDANFPRGGGILVRNALNFTIKNCVIKNNRASSGGGIQVGVGSVNLVNTQIFNNYATSGGGILLSGNGRAFFDVVERCSVYENYAGMVNDILAVDAGYVMDVYLNMSTVYPPTDYYIYYYKSVPGWPGYFNSINVLNGYRSEVNQDLYVSPIGNDENDGLSSDSPLKSIVKALHTIQSDSLNPKTIHLASGSYSSQDGQLFPIGFKAYVNLVGDATSPPVLLNLDYSWSLYSFNAPGSLIANLILEHGENIPNCVFEILHSDESTVSNLTINPVQAIIYGGILVANCRSYLDNINLNGVVAHVLSGISFLVASGSITNSSINNCQVIEGEDILYFSFISGEIDSTFVIENVSITNCIVEQQDNFIMGMIPVDNTNPDIIISNILVANNATAGNTPVIIDGVTDGTISMTNCTFANNSGGYDMAHLVGPFNISNCIFDNNTTREISVRDTQQYGFISHMNFNNNLIRGYPSSVSVHPSNEVVFNEFNFNADPGFVGTDWSNPLSYRLGNDSPCIDAGTPDTSGLYLPEVDLLGNPRIYNGIIDIGCYEWNGTGIDEDVLVITDGIKLSLYPNPVYANGSKGSYGFIEFTLPKKAKEPPVVEIYNLKGQRVRSLTICQSYNDLVRKAGLSKEVNTGGEFYSTVFDCKDMNSRPLSSGIYLIRVKADGRQKTAKLTILR